LGRADRGAEHNSDESVRHVFDVTAGADLPDRIAGTKDRLRDLAR